MQYQELTMSRLIRLLFAILLMQFMLMPAGYAQEAAEEAPAAAETPAPVEPVEPQDALGRYTPRGSLQGFLQAADDKDFIKAVEYLDLRNLPRRYRNAQPTQLAEMLAVVIEREIWIDFAELSNNPDGELGDGLPDYRDELGRIEGDDKDYILLMQHIPDGKGGRIWKVSNETVAKIADLYSEFGYGPIAQTFADSIPDADFMGLELFKWALMIGAGLVSYPVFVLLGYLLARIFSHPSSPLYPRVKRFFILPFALLLVARVMDYVVMNLGLGIRAQKMLEAQTITTLLILWALLVLVGLLRDYYANRFTAEGREGSVVLLRPAAQAAQILLVIVVFLIWLANTGYNITTILAGLGVGGIAVALALQKPLEDVFGALSLYTLQPVKIGDFCRIGPETGTVEEIGLRTTRIRTRATTLISIPNALMAMESIDNYSARQKFLYNPTLRLRVDTSAEQIDTLLGSLRDMLAGHEKIIQGDAPRVRFQAIGVDALELIVFAYISVDNFPDYLEIAEELNIQVMGILAAASVTLAVPARSIQMEAQGSPV
jgi:MscS family membrane protein